MTNSSSHNRDVPSLTGIRGLAAAWVVLLHFGEEISVLVPQFKHLGFIWERGHEGVPLFYILSGFILAFVYKGWSFDFANFPKFIRHRIFRIYPVYLATLLFLGALVVASRLLNITISGEYELIPYACDLAMVQKFPFVDMPTWNYPAWTVSVEWFAYLLAFPAGCMAMRQPFVRKYALALCMMLVVAYFFTDGSAIRGALLFLSGMLLHEYSTHGSKPYFAWIGSLLLVAIPFWLFFLPDWLCRSLFVLSCPFIILACLSPHSLCTKIFEFKPVLFLGLISYSLYLTHAIVEKLLKISLNEQKFADSSFSIRLIVAGFYIVAIAGAAIASYYLIERPSRSWLRKKFG